MVLSPGGISILFVMPIVGALVPKVDVRKMIAFGLLICGSALLLFTTIDAQVDYWTLAMIRLFQALGLAFLFIPINTAAFAGIPMIKSSGASAIINLSRNLGGSFGIALTQTYFAQQQQKHQVALVAHVETSGGAGSHYLEAMTRHFVEAGHTLTESAQLALRQIYIVVQGQAAMLAVLDAFSLLGLLFLALIPLCFVLKKAVPHSNGSPAKETPPAH
jgi:DHA2 family multidrug resistance protein